MWQETTLEYNQLDAIVKHLHFTFQDAREQYEQARNERALSTLVFDDYLYKADEATYESFDAIEKALQTIEQSIVKARRELENVREKDEIIQNRYFSPCFHSNL